MLKTVAITGGIGSGKSTVLNILKNKGYPTFSCDEIYKELIFDKQYIKSISENFKNVVFDGVIDRKKLAEKVFSDEKKLELLNEIAHPLIMQRLQEKIKRIDDGLVFAEIPVLFESKEDYAKNFSKIIVVRRNKSKRIESVIERDEVTKEDVEKRILAQYDYDTFNSLANLKQYPVEFLINDGTIEKLEKELFKLIEECM